MNGAAVSDYVLRCVLLCFLSGFLLGLLFSVLKMVRTICGLHKLGTAFLDILFFAAAAVVSFLVAFAMDHGRARFFQIGIELIGFCVFMLLLDPLLAYPTQKVNIMIHKILRKTAAKFQRFQRKKKEKRRQTRKKSGKGGLNRKKSEKRLEKLM